MIGDEVSRGAGIRLCIRHVRGVRACEQHAGRGSSSESGAGKAQAALLFGRLSAWPGILLVVPGLLTASGVGPAVTGLVPMAAMGAVLGMVGYALGARRLGLAAAVFSGAALILGIMVSQGLIPGLERVDPATPSKATPED